MKEDYRFEGDSWHADLALSSAKHNAARLDNYKEIR